MVYFDRQKQGKKILLNNTVDNHQKGQPNWPDWQCHLADGSKGQYTFLISIMALLLLEQNDKRKLRTKPLWAKKTGAEHLGVKMFVG